MPVTLNGTSQYLYVEPQVSAIDGGTPYWISAWVKPSENDPTDAFCVVSSEESDASDGVTLIYDNWLAKAQVVGGGGFDQAVSEKSVIPSLWNHVGAQFDSATSRKVYLQGILGDTNTNSRTPSFSITTRTTLGARHGLTQKLEGQIAKVAIGTGTLTDSQWSQIANGTLDPSGLGSCTNYWDLSSDGTDSVGTDDLTVVGSPSFTSETVALPSFPPREDIISWLFKQTSLPTYQPTVTDNGGSTPISSVTNLDSVDRLDITISGESSNSLTTRSWLHTPSSGVEDHLVIVHQGHDPEDTVGIGDLTRDLVADGYPVLLMPLPGWGSSGQSGSADTTNHDSFSSELTGTFNPMEYFIGPVVAALNAIANNYTRISMVGLSGGAVVTNIASAIDVRINHAVISYRGSIADSFFTGTTMDTDWEQNVESRGYRNEDYYQWAATNRRLTVVHHPTDTCCFTKSPSSSIGAYRDITDYDTDIFAPIRIAVGHDEVQVLEDTGTSTHSVTQDGIDNIIIPELESLPAINLSSSIISVSDEASALFVAAVPPVPDNPAYKPCEFSEPPNTTRVILQAPYPNLQVTTVMPRPQFGDSEGFSAASVDIKRSMNNKKFSYVDRKDTRRSLVLNFRLSRHKSLELKKFVEAFIGDKILFTDHLDRKWIAEFITNPTELTGERRSLNSPGNEQYTVQIQLEGKLV